METSGSPVAFAVGPGDAPELSRLFDRPGPFVSVALATDTSLDNAAQRSLQRWRPLRAQLQAEGVVDAATLDAVEALVPDAHHGGEGFFAVAAGGEVLLCRALPEAPDRDRATTGDVPSILPLIEHRQLHRPHVIVLADRTGADILALGPHGEGGEVTAGDNDPSDPVIRKTSPGGWSQRRYQERAERTWEDNAKAVAARVADVARLVDPAAILVAGDVRAVAFLRDELDPRLAPLVRELDGTRAADGSDDAVLDDARRQVATVAAEDTVALLEKFREEKGQRDRATDGLLDTIAALNEASVETLLIGQDADDARSLWFSADQPLVATSRGDLEAYGVATPRQGRVADVLVRSAFLTGARVRVVPRTVVTDGVGAVLRFRSDG